MIAVSESTPGPIMVNLATYIGVQQAGFFGAFLATLAVILPSFIVILAVSRALEHFSENKLLKSAMKGIKPCIAGIILAAGIQLCAKYVITLRSVVIALILAFTLFRLKPSPLMFIIISALLGSIAG